METGDELQIKLNQLTEISKLDIVKKENVKQYIIKYIDESNNAINYKVNII